MGKKMAKQKKYTRAQQKAYYSGMGYRAGQEGKKIPFKNEKNLNSFRQGYQKARVAVSRYPNK